MTAATAADGAWAVRLPKEKATAAGSLRLRLGVLALEEGDALWLRGERLSDDLDLALRKLPGAARFALAADGTLTPRGARIPAGSLPGSPQAWRPLATVVAPAPQPAALAGAPPTTVVLRLDRTGREAPATILLTTLAAWRAHAATAPLVRLRRLTFAAASDGRALVRGAPLPPLAGRRYVERSGIAVPCGFALWPAVDPATLHALLGTGPADLALFDEDGSWERIDADGFAAATRAAVRATASAVTGAADAPSGVEPR